MENRLNVNYEEYEKILPPEYGLLKDGLPMSITPFIDVVIGGPYGPYIHQKDAEDKREELKKELNSDEIRLTCVMDKKKRRTFGIIVPLFLAKQIKEPITIINVNIMPNVLSYAPPVYRFMDEKYVEKFFNTGELLISSMFRCTTKETKDRIDINECKNLIIENDNDRFSIEVLQSVNLPVLLLCSSLSQEDNYCEIKHKHGIKISGIQGFAKTLLDYLIDNGVKVYKLILGPCFYSDKVLSSIADREKLKEFIDDFSLGKMNKNMDELIHRNIKPILFNKPHMYFKENEFRIVYILGDNLSNMNISNNIKVNKDGSIIIKMPDLIKYCERF